MTEQNEHNDALTILKNAIDKGHRFILCVEVPGSGYCRVTNIESVTDESRTLSRFARRAREAVELPDSRLVGQRVAA